MESKSLGFIGGGRITKIFLQALANKQIDFSSVVVCETNSEVLNALKKQFPKIQMTDSCIMAAKQNIVFIALHPPVIMETLEQIKESVALLDMDKLMLTHTTSTYPCEPEELNLGMIQTLKDSFSIPIGFIP